MTDPFHVFDRRAVRLHRARAARLVDAVSPVLADAADRLLDRLDDTTHRFARALDIGGRGIVAPLLRARGIETVACDLAAAMAERSAPLAVVADEEFLPFGPSSFDLIVASLSLHWVNDLPGALIQIRLALRPDGLFLASLPAVGTLTELRTALTEVEAQLTGGGAPRVSPLADLRDYASLLQRAGFALPVADLENVSLSYADPLGLLRDLRAAGETNAVSLRHRHFAPRNLFGATVAAMPTEGGRWPVTLRLAILTGWAPGPSQPKPLQPGSGATSLRVALGSQGRSDADRDEGGS